jgi:hypothetical protein
MKKAILFVMLIFMWLSASAYTMGQYAKTFTDPTRNNRQILTWIYYPIDEANPGSVYPYYIFGHGWNGNCTYYTTFTMAMVNLGWIVAYPRTEEGMFSYNTQSLALDMAFLKGAVYNESLLTASPIFGKVDTLAIVGGYSMGGACAVAAANFNPDFASLVTLAAAPATLLNLYPSAITMAVSVTRPSVTFSGSADTVAPPNTNQIPIFNNLASEYKSFVSFNGQVHDSFYNNPLIPVILAPWFSYIKTGSVYYIDEFESVLDYYGSSLTYNIVDNLVITLDSPANIFLELSAGFVTISWDRILEAHGYEVYQSDNPYAGYVEVTQQGSMMSGERIVWTYQLPIGNSKFYMVKAIRQ